MGSSKINDCRIPDKFIVMTSVVKDLQGTETIFDSNIALMHSKSSINNTRLRMTSKVYDSFIGSYIETLPIEEVVDNNNIGIEITDKVCDSTRNGNIKEIHCNIYCNNKKYTMRLEACSVLNAIIECGTDQGRLNGVCRLGYDNGHIYVITPSEYDKYIESNQNSSAKKVTKTVVYKEGTLYTTESGGTSEFYLCKVYNYFKWDNNNRYGLPNITVLEKPEPLYIFANANNFYSYQSKNYTVDKVSDIINWGKTNKITVSQYGSNKSEYIPKLVDLFGGDLIKTKKVSRVVVDFNLINDIDIGNIRETIIDLQNELINTIGKSNIDTRHFGYYGAHRIMGLVAEESDKISDEDMMKRIEVIRELIGEGKFIEYKGEKLPGYKRHKK